MRIPNEFLRSFCQLSKSRNILNGNSMQFFGVTFGRQFSCFQKFLHKHAIFFLEIWWNIFVLSMWNYGIQLDLCVSSTSEKTHNFGRVLSPCRHVCTLLIQHHKLLNSDFGMVHRKDKDDFGWMFCAESKEWPDINSWIHHHNALFCWLRGIICWVQPTWFSVLSWRQIKWLF